MSLNKTGCVVSYGDNEIYAELILPNQDFSREARSVYTGFRIDAIIQMFKLISPIKEAVIENFSFGSRSNALTALGEQRGMLQMLLLKNNITLVAYSPKTIKKFATGNASAEKDELIEKLPKNIRKYFNKVLLGNGQNPLFLNDLSDAYFLLMLHLSKQDKL